MTTGKIMQFLKDRYLITDSDTEIIEVTEDEASISDTKLAHTYGWWVLIDGRRVASLEFRAVLDETVHLYSVAVLDDKFFAIHLDPTKWATPHVILQSRYAEDYKKAGLEMASVGDDLILTQHLTIPREYEMRQEDKITALLASLKAKIQK